MAWHNLPHFCCANFCHSKFRLFLTPSPPPRGIGQATTAKCTFNLCCRCPGRDFLRNFLRNLGYFLPPGSAANTFRLQGGAVPVYCMSGSAFILVRTPKNCFVVYLYTRVSRGFQRMMLCTHKMFCVSAEPPKNCDSRNCTQRTKFGGVPKCSAPENAPPPSPPAGVLHTGQSNKVLRAALASFAKPGRPAAHYGTAPAPAPAPAHACVPSTACRFPNGEKKRFISCFVAFGGRPYT